jgi:DNA repair exonuclease SbcCD nuclease subunit
VVGTLSNKEGNFDILDYSDLHKKPKNFSEQRVCFTHVRGEILPHVKPEVDLSIFDAYALVVAGDLHSHQNTQATQAGTPIVYPGSPLTTSFHRQRTKNTNGYLVVDTECKTYEWYDLGHLPQLIRKTIPADRLELMVPDRYDRVIYEVEGDLTELKSVKNSELLDKKVNKNVGRKATLNLSKNEGITKELVLYLTKVQNLPETRVKILVSKFKDLVPDAN